MPNDVKPVVVPTPPAAVPIEVTDTRAAVSVAVDRAPEENCFILPLHGNEVWIGEIKLQQLGSVNGDVTELLAKFVALDYFAVLLVKVEIKRNLCGVEFHESFDPSQQLFVVWQDRPAVGNERKLVEIHHILEDFHFGATKEDFTEKSEIVPQGHLVD